MNATDFYSELIEQSFNFWLDDGALKYRAPKGKMTPDLLADLKSHKSGLIALLAQNDHHKTFVVKPVIQVHPYTATELNTLLARCEKPLFYHLVFCERCNLEDARYCADGYAMGSVYDALLLVFDDAQDKRYRLMNQVIKARVTDRNLFVPSSEAFVPLPTKATVKSLVYGIGEAEQVLVSHCMTCASCKPKNRFYCAEGLRLQVLA